MSLPRILLLGDSIRMSYQPIVAGLLLGQAEVVGPAENCTDSANTRARLDRWLDLYRPVAVHWNNGLHDIKRARNGAGRQVELPDYAANLRAIADRLLELMPGRVIWATITPVLEAPHNAVKEFDRFNADIDAYNRAARTVMVEKKIPVNDMHALINSDPARFVLASDGVHLTDAGRCAAALAATVTLRTLLSVAAAPPPVKLP